MTAMTKFNSFVAALATKQHNLATDTFKAMFTNSAPSLTNTVPSDIAEIAAGGGYTTGGIAMAVTLATQTAGVFTWKLADGVLTATGAVATARYAVLYNATANLLIGFIDRGASTGGMVTGDVATVDFTDADVVFTLT